MPAAISTKPRKTTDARVGTSGSIMQNDPKTSSAIPSSRKHHEDDVECPEVVDAPGFPFRRDRVRERLLENRPNGFLAGHPRLTDEHQLRGGWFLTRRRRLGQFEPATLARNVQDAVVARF
jgi:hypothetical protein